MTIFEKVLRRLLRESREPDLSFAALSFNSGVGRVAVLYDPKDLVENFKEILDPDQRPRFFEDYGIADIIRGVVAIKPTSKMLGRCWGAWQIAYIAGPGWGHMLYSIAQAMSPSGLLTPDRTSVSDNASGAWASSLKLNRHRKPFDDLRDPKTPPAEDDCILHPGQDHLNWAYAPAGGESGLLDALRRNHDVAMEQVPVDVRHELISILQEESDIFADRHLSHIK